MVRRDLRRHARALVRDCALELAAGGASGRALAAAVEAACPYDGDDRPRRRAWQEARRAIVGRLRHREGRAREWAGILAMGGGEG